MEFHSQTIGHGICGGKGIGLSQANAPGPQEGRLGLALNLAPKCHFSGRQAVFGFRACVESGLIREQGKSADIAE